MTRFEVRPLGPWGRPKTESRKSSGQFKAKWEDTITLLRTEVEHLGGDVIACQVDVTEGEIRRDGMLKVGAKVGFPGVKISFESVHGPLTYATDVYEKQWTGAMPGWQANVRAVALGLHALRAVDRYGITRSGEQYRGWTALAGKPFGRDEMTPEQAAQVLSGSAGFPALERELLADKKVVAAAYRSAARRHHPDAGGSQQAFEMITRARDVLLDAAR